MCLLYEAPGLRRGHAGLRGRVTSLKLHGRPLEGSLQKYTPY